VYVKQLTGVYAFVLVIKCIRKCTTLYRTVHVELISMLFFLHVNIYALFSLFHTVFEDHVNRHVISELQHLG